MSILIILQLCYNRDMKILIVEDDRDTANMIKIGLNSDSHTVEIANDGAEGSFLARSYPYDAVVLDYSLPKKDGLKVCSEIRSMGKITPIIFLSSTDDISVKILALSKGADDYMTKPFSIQELQARIIALTRRSLKINEPIIKVGDITVDTNKQTVHRKSRLLHLTRKEFNLLEYMAKNTGTVLSRAVILEHVWTSDNDPLSNTVEAHIRNLRKKLNINRGRDMIMNIQGRGYIMDSPENLYKIHH